MMFKWLKQRKINTLLIELAYDRAYAKALDTCNEVDPACNARIAENLERLSQLGWLSDQEAQEREKASFNAQEAIRKAFHDQEVKRG
jgi:hypothetical protein